MKLIASVVHSFASSAQLLARIRFTVNKKSQDKIKNIFSHLLESLINTIARNIYSIISLAFSLWSESSAVGCAGGAIIIFYGVWHLLLHPTVQWWNRRWNQMLLNLNYRLLRRSPLNSFYSRPNPKSVCSRNYHGWNIPLKWRENRSARNRTCVASSVSFIPMNESRSAFMLSMPICVVSSCCRTKIAITFHWNLLEAIPFIEFVYLIFYWCISICFKSKCFFARTVTIFAVTFRAISWTDTLEAALHRFDQSQCERTVGRYVFQQSSHFVMTFAHHIYIV